MVLIITNENNPATLKLVIANNFAKRDVNIKIIQANGKFHHFFIFESTTW